MEEKSNTFLLYSRKIELIQPFYSLFRAEFEQNRKISNNNDMHKSRKEKLKTEYKNVENSCI